MSYASLTEKIKLLPEDRLDIVEKYIEQLLSEYRNKTYKEPIKGKRRLVIANGKYIIPENIDLLNDEVAKLFGVE